MKDLDTILLQIFKPSMLLSDLAFSSVFFKWKTHEPSLMAAVIRNILGGGAKVKNKHQWDLKVAGLPPDPPPSAEALLADLHGTSIPDENSMILRFACAPLEILLQVHWREVWSDNVVFWHTIHLKTFGFH